MKKNYKSIGIITIFIAIGVFLLSKYLMGGRNELEKNDKEEIFVEEQNQDGGVSQTSQKEKNKIVVEIKGEVSKPDVYWLEEDSIVQDLLTLAGGLTSEADITSINRAEKLNNHDVLIVPNKNSNEGNNLRNNNDISRNDLVNINKATEEELKALNGIGASKATAIISYREKNGEFKKIEDIKNVKGIGESCFEKIKDKIRI
ncbi:MAG: competence protein ComEA [Clostridium sp.]|nr:competence protein ComEA [Clostridium sp.]